MKTATPAVLDRHNVNTLKWTQAWRVCKSSLELTHLKTGLRLKAYPSSWPDKPQTLFRVSPHEGRWALMQATGVTLASLKRTDAAKLRLLQEAMALATYHYAGLCEGCSVETVTGLDPSNYYMLKNKVWAAITPNRRTLFCFDCAQHKLGRLFVINDFIDCPANRWNKRVMALGTPSGGLDD